MTQKIIGAVVVVGLIWAGYMAFFTDKKETMMDDTDMVTLEEATVSTGVTVAETAEGMEYFATEEGMALYTFAKDEFNVSNCNGECLVKWPVFYSADLLAADGFGTITRADGALQSTYLEKPLYTFFKDVAAGETKGHGAKGVWFLATFSK